jgi:hypothetical protein
VTWIEQTRGLSADLRFTVEVGADNVAISIHGMVERDSERHALEPAEPEI